MKKLSLILIILISISFYVSAYEYETEEIQSEASDNIIQVFSNGYTLGDGTFCKLYNTAGNSLTEKWYYRIWPSNYEHSVYVGLCKDIYVTNEEDKYTYENMFEQNRVNIYLDKAEYERLKKHADDSDSENLNITDGVAIVDARNDFDSEGKLLYSSQTSEKESVYEYTKLFAHRTEDKRFELVNSSGTPVIPYTYETAYEDGVTPGYLTFANADEIKLIANTTTGEWAEVNSLITVTNIYNKGYGFVEKTQNGKYIYYDNHLNKATDIEFDEYIGKYGQSVVFKHEGQYYGFDTDWQLAYKGERKIKAVFYGAFVIENKDGFLGLYDNDFNEIIPPECENIYGICENVYVAEKGEKNFLYNQSRIVAENYWFYIIDYENVVFEDKGMFLPVKDRTTNEYCIADIEGNEIIRSKNGKFKTNGYDVYINYRDKAPEKIIFKNTNPNIRINEKLLVSDTMARIKNNITLVPIRALAEKTGFEVSFNAETKEINITKDDKEIKFTLGEKKCYSNGKEITLEAAPEVINNRTLVPLRALSDTFGYDISWDGERRLIEITI